MKHLLLKFENEEKLDQFIQNINALCSINLNDEYADTLKQISMTISEAERDPLLKDDSERQTSLFVSGVKILDGNLLELNKKFNEEIASHSGSVEIREKRGDQWTVVRRRRKQ